MLDSSKAHRESFHPTISDCRRIYNKVTCKMWYEHVLLQLLFLLRNNPQEQVNQHFIMNCHCNPPWNPQLLCPDAEVLWLGCEAAQSQWHLFKSLDSLWTIHDTESHHIDFDKGNLTRSQWWLILDLGAAVALHKLRNMNAWWKTTGFLTAQRHRQFTTTIV